MTKSVRNIKVNDPSMIFKSGYLVRVFSEKLLKNFAPHNFFPKNFEPLDCYWFYFALLDPVLIALTYSAHIFTPRR